MFKEKDKMATDIRTNMRGGNGSVELLQLLTPEEMRGKCRLFSKVTLQPGCSIGSHVHDREEEIYYILSGTGTVDDNGTTREIKAGDLLLTGGGEHHAIENTGTEPLVFMAAINLFD